MKGIAFAGLLLALGAPASAKGAAYAAYELKEGRFSCQLPKDWSQRRDPGVEARENAFGVFLTGPRSDDGVSAKIDVRYYAPGNKVFAKPDDFMKANLEPSPIPRKGEKPPKVEKTMVAGLPARRFTRHDAEFIPPSSLNTKEIPITDDVVLVEAKTGFYALTYSAPNSLYAKHRALFEHVIKTFHPAP
ncbi:MAG: hypothetical protein HY077_09445 [Elusimicrobia bacterium]|nr:hypothetical protein [Elusimicrobiota bacterium]